MSHVPHRFAGPRLRRFSARAKTLRVRLGQYPLNDQAYAACTGAPSPNAARVSPIAKRALGLGGLVLLLGLVTAGGLAVAALLGNGAGELAMLGLLVLLAVAGVFFILGLMSGYLRVSERVAEAEMVKTIADGLEMGLKIV